MLTKDDKDWIEEAVEEKLVSLEESNVRTEEKITHIEEKIIRTEEKIDKVLNILDGFSGKVAELEQENRMGSMTLRRHDTQIHELAQATGTKISK